MWNPVKQFLSKRSLGIDIGISHVKMVEIYKSGRQKKLENYGQISPSIFREKSFKKLRKSSLLFSSQDIAQAIELILSETKIKTRQAVFSIPDFATFFTSFKLPPMTKDELPDAVRYEARQHIPISLTEVVLDWQIIKSTPLDKKKTSFKILLVAVPNEVVKQCEEVARISQLELLALEAEVFSLIRSLIGANEKQKQVALIDIGAKTSTCSIVDEKILKISHSFDASGNDLTNALAKSLGIDFSKAEIMKKQYGIKGDKAVSGLAVNSETVKGALLPLIDIIVKEINGILDNFYQQEKKEVKKIIITGGTALLPGLKEYFQACFKQKEVEIGNPFSDISFPPVLEETLKEMGPSFAIAAGAALRGFND